MSEGKQKRGGSIKKSAIFWVYGILHPLITITVLCAIYIRYTPTLTPDAIMDYVGVAITALSVLLTLALAILAINAFANNREITILREKASTAIKSIDEDYKDFFVKSKILDKILPALRTAVDAVRDEFESNKSDNYMKLLQSSFIINAMLETDPNKKLEHCRHIIGIIEKTHSQEILQTARDMCHSLAKELPDEKNTIDALVLEADKMLISMRERS